MAYEVKHMTPKEVASIKATFPKAQPKAYASVESTPRNPERPYFVLAYYDTEAEAQADIVQWEARDKVADMTESMDIFDTIWPAIKDSGLNEDEVREIIKEHI